MDKIIVFITQNTVSIEKKNPPNTVTKKPRVIKYEIVKQDALNF